MSDISDIKLHKSEIMKNWYEKNKEYHKNRCCVANKKYYEEHKQELINKNKEYFDKIPTEKRKEYARKAYLNKKEKEKYLSLFFIKSAIQLNPFPWQIVIPVYALTSLIHLFINFENFSLILLLNGSLIIFVMYSLGNFINKYSRQFKFITYLSVLSLTSILFLLNAQYSLKGFDPEFVQEARRQALDVEEPMSGEDLQDLIQQIQATPKSVSSTLVNLFNDYNRRN